MSMADNGACKTNCCNSEYSSKMECGKKAGSGKSERSDGSGIKKMHINTKEHLTESMKKAVFSTKKRFQDGRLDVYEA